MAADTQAVSSDAWSDSTSPSASPSAAVLSACLNLERRVSGTSSATSVSGTSNNGSSAPDAAGKRRGFSRPQGTAFADSARNRDSVMSLGTIAHLQHYFARTGLLDGKGAQLAKEDDLKKLGPAGRSLSGSSQPGSAPLQTSPPLDEPSFLSVSKLDTSDSFTSDDASFVSSPDQASADVSWDEPHALSLPPTVSTYKQKSNYVPPPPNLAVLRRELREALEDAKKLLADVRAEQRQRGAEALSNPTTPSKNARDKDPLQGWYEIQGLQVLDLLTLAIRAAKNFYTSHEQPTRLYAIQSERQIRTELFHVLDMLKKLATRNFAGGIRKAEISAMTAWITGIEELVQKDEEAENLENERRQSWSWQGSDWTGRERERERAFLRSFDTDTEPLPEWAELPDGDDGLPTPFLKALQDGRRLVRLHNELVRKSRRHFEEIKFHHNDVAKPYRCAENLRYWIKAAELRWDVHLDVQVLGVVHGDSAPAWRGFDAALLKWCSTVREQITREWQEHDEALKFERPIVRMDQAGDMSAVPW